MNRRAFLQSTAALGAAVSAANEPEKNWRIAIFSADVTVPAGHGMMGGAWLSKTTLDPLEAHGFVLLGAEQPLVFVAVDWCEIRNDAFDRWRAVLAEAAGTTSQRVMLSALHQHDAPVADLAAERLLREAGAKGTVCDPEFHERAVQAVAAALRASMKDARAATHIGTGQARVRRVASNRRYELPGGGIRFDRMSRTADVFARAADEGVIDPWLKTLSFWDGDRPLLALHAYAVHPMAWYGQGEVSADFPGLARRLRQAETPGVRQIYASGCSGNVTAGRHNDGPPHSRGILAERLRRAMEEAWEQTTRSALTSMAHRIARVKFSPREGSGWSEEELAKRIPGSEKPFGQCLAAMGLAWRRRLQAGHEVEIPAIDFGAAQLIILPGEAYVEYQLAAQRARPNQFIVTAGYGEAGMGYIPTERHIAEGDTNLSDWWWIAPGAEEPLRGAIRRALGTED